jgi:HEAT repeat protein
MSRPTYNAEGTYALIVGIEQYDFVGTLPGAVASALEFEKWLLGLGVSNAHVIKLLSSLPTKLPTFNNIRAAIEELRSRCGDVLFFYWAGHGAAHELDNTLFFSDSKAAHWTFSVEYLRELLQSKPHENFPLVFGFVDACANAVDPPFQYPRFKFPESTTPDPGKEQFLFFAARPGQIAEYSSIGLFTKELLDELKSYRLPLSLTDFDNLDTKVASRLESLRARPTVYRHFNRRGWVSRWDSEFNDRTLITTYLNRISSEFAHEFDYNFIPLSTQPGTIRPRPLALRLAGERLRESPFPGTFSLPPSRELKPDDRQLPSSPEHFLDSYKRIVLLGPPGAGKSALLRRLCKTFSDSLLNSAEMPSLKRPLPIYAALNRWGDKNIGLLSFLREELSRAGIPQLAERLDTLLREGSIVLLLDGLNELPAASLDKENGLRKDPRLQAIEKLGDENDWLKARCVVSCRINDFSSAPLWRDLHILPLNREQVESFASKLVDDQVAQRFISDLFNETDDPRQSRMRALATTPFFLTRLITYYDKLVSLNPEEKPALNHAQLINFAVNEGFAKMIEKQQLAGVEEAETVRQHLAHLAFNMTEAGFLVRVPRRLASLLLMWGGESHSRYQWAPKVHFLDRNPWKWIYEGTGKPQLTSAQEQEALDFWPKAHATGLIQITSGHHIEFQHQLFQEYFCASFCSVRLHNDKILVQDLGGELSSFDEVWSMWAELDPGLVDELNKRFDLDKGDNSPLAGIRRDCVVRALGLTKDRRATDALMVALKDPEWLVRTRAASALANNPVREAFNSLADALKDPECPFVRSFAAIALGQIGDADAVPSLIRAFEDERDIVAQHHIAEALCRLGRPAVNPLVACLDGEPAVAPLAARALGVIGDRHAVDPLLALVEDTRRDRGLRLEAIRALGELGDRRALGTLERFARDLSDYAISKEAEQAVERVRVVSGLQISPPEDPTLGI